MLTEKKISIIVPCYKDEANIEELVKQLKNTLETVTLDWEIIYINDSSPDDSASILKKISAEDKRIIVVNFSRNFGVMSAFHAGMEIADGDAVITMDGDIQDPPGLIPEFIKKWNEGFLVVYGIRESREEVWYRKIGYKYFYLIWRKLADVEMPLNVGEFALIDKRVNDIIISIPERDRFLRGIRTWVGFPQTGIPYNREKRYARNSTQSMASYIGWSLKAISSFSIKPLRLVFYMALSMSFFFVALLGYNIFEYLAGTEAPHGFFTLLFVGLFGSMAQLVALSIIAEYLIHIIQEVKRRPQYIIESVINLPKGRKIPRYEDG